LPSHLRRLADKQPRHWRLILALMADRVERRIGRSLSDAELKRLDAGGAWSDRLYMRQQWFQLGGHLEIRAGRLELSRTLDKTRIRVP